MGLRRLAISNPGANTDTTLFTADNQYLLSVIATNTSASSSNIRVWVQPSGASALSEYAFIVYDLPVDGKNSYETFRFAVNQNDLIRVRADSASVSFQAYGLVQYDVNLGVGISSFQSASPTSPVDGLIWVDSDGVISGSDAKPVYVWSNSANNWLPFAGAVTNTAANYTWTGTNNFSASTSIGNVSATEISYLDDVSSSIQTQLNNKADLASPSLTGTPTAPTAASGTSTTQIATTAFVANNFEKLIPLQSSAPTSPATSDLWVDSSGATPILRVYNGTSWVALASPADDDQNILANRVFA